MSKITPISPLRRHAGKSAAALAIGLTAYLLAGPQAVFAGDQAAMHHDHQAMTHDHAAMAHDHSMHAAALEQKPTIRSVSSYPVPDVKLTGTDGEKVALNAALAQGPVMVNFIYTTCTTICPVLSATFSEVQNKLAAEGSQVNMISISIDPDQDTPARLKEYAAKFHAGPNWQFLTGSVAESVAVQKAFDAYRGDKMNHNPLTLMRASPKSPWVRVDGFASAAELVAQYRKIVADKVASR